MNFREYFTQDNLVQLATRIFGDCHAMPISQDYYDDEEDDYVQVMCKFRNRDIEFVYMPDENLVDISFFWLEEPEGLIGPKQDMLRQARQLQAGSIEGTRKFEEFARELKKMGVGLTYSASGKRSKIYRKGMQRAGMDLQRSRVAHVAPVWR